MRRYNDNEFDDRDYSRENSVDDYDMRSYARHNGYHNMDYDDKNWWQPEEEYEYENERSGDKDDYDFAETRRRRLRPLGMRRRVYDNGTRGSYDHDRKYDRENNIDDRYNNRGNENNFRNWYGNGSRRKASQSGMNRSSWNREYDYHNEGYGGRNADDYISRNYDSGYYYNPDDHNTSDVRNRNEYEYDDNRNDDSGRRWRKRWSEDYDYYGSYPSYRRKDDDYLEPQGNERSWSRRNSRRERMDDQDVERGKFSDRRHDFGYYADDRYDDYPRRRPNIRDSVY
jgi:hypothetical protein